MFLERFTVFWLTHFYYSPPYRLSAMTIEMHRIATTPSLPPSLFTFAGYPSVQGA
jgi:hypothetical protein